MATKTWVTSNDYHCEVNNFPDFFGKILVPGKWHSGTQTSNRDVTTVSFCGGLSNKKAESYYLSGSFFVNRAPGLYFMTKMSTFLFLGLSVFKGLLAVTG